MALFSCVLILVLCLILTAFPHIIKSKQRKHRPTTFWGDDLFDKKALRDDNIKYIDLKEASNPSIPVTLIVSPSNLTTPNGLQLLEMSWSNAVNAESNDWIGIYSPISSAHNEWLDWFYTDASLNGQYQKYIWNMRDNFEIRYFLDNGNGTVYFQSSSNVATVNPKQPLQGHISLTANSPNEMQIRWVSALVTNPQVYIGLNSNKYTKLYNASFYTYDTSNFCGGSASIVSPTLFRDPGYFYTVIVSELNPNTKYYYKFGSNDMWSDEHKFITSSVVGSNDEFEFIMYGDQGGAQISDTNSWNVIRSIQNELDKEDNNIRLLLHVGDLSYGVGYGYIWEQWSNMVANIASTIPYMVSVGNHEYDHTSPVNNKNSNGLDLSGVAGTGYHPNWGNEGDDSYGECGAPTYYRYNAPLGNTSNSIFWYSFDVHMVHFIMLSSEHNYTVNSDGYQWLLNDLKQANIDKNNNKISWIILNIHRPIYESEIFPADNAEDAGLLHLLEPTLFKYNVDLLLAGHFHSYERTCALYNYTCIGRENGGITHMTIGTAGTTLDNALYQNANWSVFRDEIDWGYGKFMVNTTTLIGQFVATNAGIVDQVILNKK
eukprot:70317_1